MEVLGHSQISVTMNIYTDVLPTLQQDALNKMDGLFETGSKPIPDADAVNDAVNGPGQMPTR